MATRRVHRCLRHLVINCLVLILLSAAICIGQEIHSSTSNTSNALKLFLQKELSDAAYGVDKTTRYSSAIINPDEHGKEEIVVYLSGQSWCGSGGCRMQVLDRDGETFTVIGNLTIVRLPIRVFKSKSHGHYDLGVWVQGGGIQPVRLASFVGPAVAVNFGPPVAG